MSLTERIHALVAQLYPTEAERVSSQVMARLQPLPATLPGGDYFAERTVTLITYGDTLLRDGEMPLRTLRTFLDAYLRGAIDTVHILPFYPYSSDDGFSVIDYYAVNPALGDWDDIRALSAEYRLMFDAVINHMSARSQWFQGFLAGDPAYAGLFVVESPDTDLSGVTRPRTSPLLTPFTRADGTTAHVWTTFSADQVDLDYRTPATLLRILDVLLFYVAQGAQVIRLDAIAYLWKRAGASCIHLPETHAVVKLLRAALDIVAPYVVLISETNVPHAENVSYFGDAGDEAQLVYNFTLPPLVLHTLIDGDAHILAEWINSLPPMASRTAFFNFTASHDGVGVRPVEGILTPGQLAALIAHVERMGGRVSYKANSDGSQSPYELNIAYVDAAGAPDLGDEMHIRRFLLTQAVMLALAGTPAIYIHSLLGSRNDYAGLERLGYNRAINRARLDISGLQAELADATSFRSRVFAGYIHLLRTRMRQPAFHPHGAQQAAALNDGRVLRIARAAPDGTHRLIALHNVTGAPAHVALDRPSIDVLAGEHCGEGLVSLAPYQVRWLVEDLP